ncbi:hypothetical protein SAMN05444673_0537 [Bacillus sp. OV166]|nr:hypothetical protein SAMN05444673_0537 [Bacillus sp. OV166]
MDVVTFGETMVLFFNFQFIFISVIKIDPGRFSYELP